VRLGCVGEATANRRWEIFTAAHAVGAAVVGGVIGDGDGFDAEGGGEEQDGEGEEWHGGLEVSDS